MSVREPVAARLPSVPAMLPCRQALEMQSRLQALFLKTSVTAFKMCTSSSSSGELSRKEKSCIRNVVSMYVESK